MSLRSALTASTARLLAAAALAALAAAPAAAAVSLRSLVGTTVTDAGGEPIGEIRDLVIEADADRVIRILLGDGSWLALEDSAVELRADGVVARRSALRQERSGVGLGTERHLASEVLEARVEDWDGRDAGEVHDVMIDAKGRILAALVRVDEGMLEPARVAALDMPPARRERPGSDDLVLTVDRRQLEAALARARRGR